MSQAIIQENNEFSIGAFFSGFDKQLSNLQKGNQTCKNITKVALNNQQKQQMEALDLNFMNPLQLKQIYTKSAQINSLFDLVGLTKPKNYEDAPLQQTKQKDSHMDFVRVPPLNKLVAPKPIVMDVAYDFIGKLILNSTNLRLSSKTPYETKRNSE